MHLLRYSVGREEKTVDRKLLLDKLLIHAPPNKAKMRPVERLRRLGEKRDRSPNCLVGE